MSDWQGLSHFMAEVEEAREKDMDEHFKRICTNETACDNCGDHGQYVSTTEASLWFDDAVQRLTRIV